MFLRWIRVEGFWYQIARYGARETLPETRGTFVQLSTNMCGNDVNGDTVVGSRDNLDN